MIEVDNRYNIISEISCLLTFSIAVGVVSAIMAMSSVVCLVFHNTTSIALLILFGDCVTKPITHAGTCYSRKYLVYYAYS